MRRFLRNTVSSRYTPIPVPFHIGGTLVGWWSGDGTRGYSAGEAMPLVPDLSGNGRHWTQSVNASRPTFQPDVRNGHDALRFSGAQVMEENTLPLLFSGGAIEIGLFAAFSVVEPVIPPYVVMALSGNLNSFITIQENVVPFLFAGNIMDVGTGNRATSQGVRGVQNVSAYKYVNVPPSSGLINGTPTPINTSVGVVSGLSLTFGRLGAFKDVTDGDVAFLTGDIYELFIIQGDCDLTAGSDYLRSKYAI